jgi:hypothetical protein
MDDPNNQNDGLSNSINLTQGEMFVLFVVFYTIVNLWVDIGMKLLNKYVIDGKGLHYNVISALIATIVFVYIITRRKLSLRLFEGRESKKDN